MGVEQPKIRKGVDKDWDRSGPRLGHEQSKIVKGVNQIGTGEAQDWEKSGTKIGTRAAQDETGTQTQGLGQKQPKTRTEACSRRLEQKYIKIGNRANQHREKSHPKLGHMIGTRAARDWDNSKDLGPLKKVLYCLSFKRNAATNLCFGFRRTSLEPLEAQRS